MRRLAAALAVALSAAAPAQAEAPLRNMILDDFETASPWTLIASDDVQATLRPVDGDHGRALCIDFDFGRVTGYVAARRTLPIEFPARYELALRVRGNAPPNALQMKLVDATGANVWWGRKNEFRVPPDWQTLRFRQREIEFAWGPAPDRALRRSAAIELVIASGSGAGKGSVCFDRLELRELPASAATAGAHGNGGLRAAGSRRCERRRRPPRDRLAACRNARCGGGADGRLWRAARVRRARAALAKRRGSVALCHRPLRRWRALARRPARRPRARRPAVALAARFRSALRSHQRRRACCQGRGAGRAGAAAPVDANAFFAELAKEAPRGRYPRSYLGQQTYWTVLGVDGGRTASLLSEDGVLEPVPGVGALEPFLIVDGNVLGWADVRSSHTLQGGDLPMPSVHWRAGDLALDISAFGDGTPDAAQALARYRVRNLGKDVRRVTLALAWRPFQANPPTQFLAHPGGASAIDALDWDGRVLTVNGAPRLRALVAPSAVRLEPLAAGPVGDWLREPRPSPAPVHLADPAGFASAALLFDLRLAAGEEREVAVALPVDGAPMASAPADIAAAEARAVAHWRARLDRVRISGPAEVEEIARTLRTSLGHILVNRSAAALQPGARAYARSWIRDGALTSSALLRLGQDDVAREFLLWFASFQFQSGKVPCCATARGADPVPEHDSDGEFAFAAADLWQYTRDEALARALWPHVRRAVEHMDALRRSERTPANLAPDRRAYFGLMPPSISHEGYSDKPAYSYWDDFWTATGYRSALELAQALGLADDATRIAGQRDEFLARPARVDLRQHDAPRARRAAGCGRPRRRRSDFEHRRPQPGRLAGDAARCARAQHLRALLARLQRTQAAVKPWDAYTPYEWRNVGSLVRLGERERALQAMAFFYRDRRPSGWNQWAEVVLRDAREPRFLGDMPHGWVASDHIRSVLDLFAYEHEGERSLVLAAGIPMAWFDGRGLTLQDLRTPYGPLSWSGRRVTNNGRTVVEIDVQPLRTQPPGGIELRGPWPRTSRVWIDGVASAGAADAIRLSRTPAHVRIELP